MADMSEVPEKCYKHLTDEDLAILLGGYRVINYKDTPDKLKDVDVPTGLELIYEVQRRLKKSGPNISWDQAVERRQQTPEGGMLPQVISVAEILDDPGYLEKRFTSLVTHLTFHNAYPAWWPMMAEAYAQFSAAISHHSHLFTNLSREPKDYCFYFPQLPNMVLEKINEERAQQGNEPKFFFIGLKAERDQLLE